MRRAPDRRTALLLGAASATGLASPTFAQEASAAARYIREKSAAWTDAYVTGNTEVMETILASDFVSTDPKGQRSGKAAAIGAARRGPSELASATVGTIEVRVYGKTAIALGGDVLVLKDDKRTQITTAWTDTWHFEEGSWRVLASHESVVSAAVA